MCFVGAVSLGVILASATALAQERASLTWRYLWNPQSPDLAEWQMIRQPAGGSSGSMIWGEPGQIFLIDARQAHVLCLTRNGDLIQVIGRRGQGPGEFTRPRVLGYDQTTRVLWVGDGNFRYSRFVLENDQYVFQDGFTSPVAWGGGAMANLVVEGRDRYWTVGRSLGLVREFSAMFGTGRIKLVDVAGGLLREFGQFWDVDEGSAWASLDQSMRNTGYLTELNGGRLAWTWMYRPIVEVWGEDGTLLAQRTLEKLPIYPPSQTGPNSSIAPPVMAAGEYDRQCDLLFIRTGGEGDVVVEFFGLDTRTLQERERYSYAIPGARREPDTLIPGRMAIPYETLDIVPDVYLVERIDGEVRFYGVDVKTGTPFVFFPKKD